MSKFWAVFAVLWLLNGAASQVAFSAEEEAAPLPPPSEIEAPFAGENGEAGEDMPAPSLGETKDEKAVADEGDELFLPPPGDGSGVATGMGYTDPELQGLMQSSQPTPSTSPYTRPAPNYAPSGTVVYSPNDEYKGLPNSRPAFSLIAGPVGRSYAYDFIRDTKFGVEAGVSLRLWQLSREMALYGQAVYNWTPVGDLLFAKHVTDNVYRFGVMGEYSFNRRWHLVLGLTYFRNAAEAGTESPPPPTSTSNQFEIANYNSFKQEMTLLKQGPKFKPGIGIQYDVYSIPHASLGVRLFFEKDYTELVFNFSFEPAPRKKLSFNYNWD